MGNCLTCFYFDPDPEQHEGDKGWCRRYPPRAAVDADEDGECVTLEVFWPIVDAFDWCGEHSNSKQ